MSEQHALWVDDARVRPAIEALVEIEARAVVTKYRMTLEAAIEAVRRSFAADMKLRKATLATAENACGAMSQLCSALQRTREYRDAVTAARQSVYQSLRRYHAEDADQGALIEELATLAVDDTDKRAEVAGRIAGTHASTRERLPDEAEFYRLIVREIAAAESLLDVGCGVQPLRFPFEQTPMLRTYVAVESNQRSIDAVAAYASGLNTPRLVVVQDDLSAGWERVAQAAAIDPFDVALLLKLVPVVERQSRELLSVLTQTPARRWIVTGSMQSLAKRTSIERRERAVIERFLRNAEKEVVSAFVVGEEFGYVAV